MLNFTAKGKVVKKILIAVVITFTGFLVGGSVSVLAGNIQVGGGVWNHGVTGVLTWGDVWPNYYHSSKTHSATACDGKAKCGFSKKSKKITAQAKHDRTNTGNTAYWSKY